MSRFALAVSTGHLFFFAAYIKLGVISPWQDAGPGFTEAFGGTGQSVVMLLSFASAPFVIGTVLWGADTFILAYLRKRPSVLLPKVRGAGFVLIGSLGLLGLVSGIIRGGVFEHSVFLPLIGFLNDRLFLAMSLGLVVVFGLFLALVSIDSLRKPVVGIVRSLLMIVAPVALFSTAGVFYLLVVQLQGRDLPDQLVREAPPSSEVFQLGDIPEKVVILLFDGMSYTTVFDDNGVVRDGLPNLRSLAQQSVVFHNNRSYRPGTTARNIPILLTGTVLEESHFDSGKNQDVASLADGTEITLLDKRNIFDTLDERGYRQNVFGMFIDYCGTYVSSGQVCESIPFYRVLLPPVSYLESLLAPYAYALGINLPGTLERNLSIIPGMRYIDRTIGNWTLELHNAILNSLKLTDATAIYAHYPIPHGAWISYELSARKFGVGSGYFETYKSVDALLGEIKRTLEDDGEWDSTLVILTSDHNESGETSDPRVPLFVKLPYSQRGVDYEGSWTQAQLFPLLEVLLEHDEIGQNGIADILDALSPKNNR